MKREKYKNKTDNKGFTLVELIIVLVILAILAAILVPALLGYIDEAKKKQSLINAKACFNAAQSELIKLYAKSNSINLNTPVISGAIELSNTGNQDQNIVGSDFAKSVLDLAGLSDDPPFCLMIAVGSNATTKKDNNKDKNYVVTDHVTEHDKYTVYYVFYQQELNMSPCYYYNGEWTDINPRKNESSNTFSTNNVILSGPLKNKRLQYYLLSNRTNYTTGTKSSKFWDWIKGKIEYGQGGFK